MLAIVIEHARKKARLCLTNNGSHFIIIFAITGAYTHCDLHGSIVLPHLTFARFESRSDNLHQSYFLYIYIRGSLELWGFRFQDMSPEPSSFF